MKVILLEKIAKLGNLGQTVEVKDGFARNFLLPLKKALKATAANEKIFAEKRKDLEIADAAKLARAQKVADQISGKTFTVLRTAGDTGRLFGSVSPKDILELLKEFDNTLKTHDVIINTPIKELGTYKIIINLGDHIHPEIELVVSNAKE